MLRWRPDGDYVGEVPPARRIMPYLMQKRNESVVYWEHRIDTTRTTPFLNELRERTGLKVTMLHLIIWASAQALHARPRMNRFTAGGRIFQRRGVWISFSAKKAKSDAHPLVVVKRRIDPSWSLEEMVRLIDEGIVEGRGKKKTTIDLELDAFLKLPNALLNVAARTMMGLDRLGLLPAAVLRSDPMYASLFIASLGSIGMDAGYHHLYEYGNIPIFAMVGRIKDEVVPQPDGRLEVRPLMTMRYTFDERVEDGLYCLQTLELFRQMMENPAEATGMAAGAMAGNRPAQTDAGALRPMRPEATTAHVRPA